MTCLLSCVNFIKIDQVVFEYGHLKVSNLLKSRIIVNSKSQKFMTKQNMNQCSPVIMLNGNEKVQVITVTNNNL